MTLHPRGSLRPGEALQLLQLQLLQGGDGQPMEGAEQRQRRELPEGAEESTRKAQRLDEDSTIPEPESKKSKALYPPTFAGQVRRVSGEQLEALDREAMLKEVEKLKEMEVTGSIPTDMTTDDALQLDTENVFDWRYRQNQCTRRCRIVAREFKDSVSTVDTFAPTTPWSGVRTLLAMSTVMKLKVAVFDV